jgi:hypothetical protein
MIRGFSTPEIGTRSHGDDGYHGHAGCVMTSASAKRIDRTPSFSLTFDKLTTPRVRIIFFLERRLAYMQCPQPPCRGSVFSIVLRIAKTD